MLIREDVKDAYRTIFTQCVTSDENFLLAGDNYGALSVFETKNWKKIESFQTELDCIYDMKIRDNFIVIAGTQGVIAQSFSGEAESFKFGDKKYLGTDDCNAAALYEDRIYAGGPSGHLSVFDLNSGKQISKTKGAHVDAIQAISASSRNLISSVGEDGNVNIWDLRSTMEKPTKVLKPFTHRMTKSASGERYLSCCSFRNDWIVTGGGPKTALWHIGSEEPAQVLELEKTNPLTTLSTDGRILVGGSGGIIHQFQNNGTKISKVPSSSPLIYSLQESANGYLFCAGNTSSIDVYRNYGYRVQQLIV